MILELLSTIAAGFGAAGIIFITFKVVRRKPPRFVVPMAAGLAMICFNFYIEYSWFDRTKDVISADAVVLQEFRDRSIIRPWSFVVAPVNRFMAIDPDRIHRNPANDALVMAEPELRQRYFNPVRVTVIVDCINGTQAELTPDVTFDQDGLPANANWYETGRGDPLFEAVCNA